jgi:steroid delta-isomerase-like uncharacterized protein
MTREEVLALCRQWQDAQERHDIDALAALYSPTVEIDSPWAGHGTGREDLIKPFEGFFRAFPDAVFTFEPPLVDGHRATVSVEIAAKHVGTFMGLPPTGKSINFRIVFLLEVQDGHIVRDRRIYDFTGLMVQVGVLKAKPV